MQRQVSIVCRCGAVRARLAEARARAVGRTICYCDDCQAAAHHLGCAEWLDARGGSDIVQVAPARLRFEQGAEQIAALRLSPRGTYRFHARCCGTPLGNMRRPAVPFIGLQAASFEGGKATADRLFGPPRGAIMGQFALGGAPPGTKGIPAGVALSVIVKVLGWRLAGLTWPHPFFARGATAPLYPVRALTPAERERLRPLCGPQPHAF